MAEGQILVQNDQEYRKWIMGLKGRIRQIQIKAALQVNEAMLRLYWEMGREISEKEKETKWGSGFFNQLSHDLQKEFPDMKGFSVQNLRLIKRFYLFYSQEDIIREQVASELGEAPIFRIPWWHHVILMGHCKSIREAQFYILKIIENNWSRSVLRGMLASGLYEASGKAVTNFRHPDDGETIGLLICRTKDKVVAEYSLQGSVQPLGISEYRLKTVLPESLQSSLPSIEEIQEGLKNQGL